MTRCLRISIAYSLRWMMRHSTLLLIAIFIGIITVILQMYAFRHEERPRYKPRIGDFDYRPGEFLRGYQPCENISYCEFNYGLPDTLNWASFTVYKSPEQSEYESHSVIYNAIKGTSYANFSKYDALTYVTQATPEFLYHIVEIARYWDGPISLAAFVPDYDLYLTMQIMNHLCRCYSEMSKISLHLFFPTKIPPKIPPKTETRITEALPTTQTEMIDKITTTITDTFFTQTLQEKIKKYKLLNETTRYEYIKWVRKSKIKRMMKRMGKRLRIPPTLHFSDCAGAKSFDVPTYRRKNHMFYPINVGRNVARNATWTNYFLVSDIEMVPSVGLATKFLRMAKNLMGRKKRKEGCIFSKTIFVVPLFEVERGEAIPRDKDTLAAMVEEKRATYFHAKSCAHCQRFPGLQYWLSRPSPYGVEPMMIVRREYPYHRWEPLYIGTHKEPWYNEMLVWEGLQDKMAQMLELCLQQYRLVILDGGFLCHASSTRKKNTVNSRAVKLNNHWYTKIVGALKVKYPDRPQCRVLWGTWLENLTVDLIHRSYNSIKRKRKRK